MPTTSSISSDPSSRIQRLRNAGMNLTIVQREHLCEYHFTLRPLAGDRPAMMLWRLDTQLREFGAQVVRHEVFGSLAAYRETVDRMKRLFPDVSWPVTWVEDSASTGQRISGMHVFAVSGVEAQSLLMGDQVVGRIFDDGYARHCLLGNVTPQDPSASREAQACETFHRLESALQLAGMTMLEVTRTWLFIEDILDWYGPFNTIRNQFFKERNLFEHTVPASTGIGARNSSRTALVAGAWAVQPNNGAVRVRELGSPLQCPAPKYGSSFSRALELASPGDSRVFVSGTASIDRVGETAHLNDIRSQIELTMDVVEAILAAQKLKFSDTTRATAYFKRLGDLSHFSEWCSRRRIAHLPFVAMQSDVCRDELLFEVELDAMAPLRTKAAPDS